MTETKPAAPTESKSWWQTLPGVLTAFAGVITAVTGLILAVRPSTSPAQSRPSVENTGTGYTQASAGASPISGSTGTTPGRQVRRFRLLRLPSPSQVKLAHGDVVIDLLRARLEPYNATTRTLTLTVRFTNNGRYDANFWAASFRLIVDGVPRAPTNGLNELVAGHSAKDGDAVFEIPNDTTSVALRLLWGDEQTDVPLEVPDRRAQESDPS